MAYRVRNDLWFCRIGESLIFLDIREDRYFRLPPSREHAFISRINDCSTPDICSALERNLFNDSLSTSPLMQVRTIPSPTRSALEQSRRKSDLRMGPLLEVSVAITMVLLRLKTQSLQDALSNMLSYRARRTSSVEEYPDETQEMQLIDAARSFSSARLLIPVEPSCLLDSIALATFLARRSLESTVVFGVTCNPFAAHSWVQVGDLILNDSVGNASAYTPIGIF